jgi:transcriptional antiterminator NusG
MEERPLEEEEQSLDDGTLEETLSDDVLSPETLAERFKVIPSAEDEEESLADFALPELEPEVVLREFEELAAEAEAEPEPEPEPEPEVVVQLGPREDGNFLPEPFAKEEEVGGDERAWFVIHCYSGYEQKVKFNLEQRIESMGMQDFIFQVVVPTVEEIEIKDGKRHTVERCLYPGYIMVQMILSDDSWYVVRNTPGVTGFVGMGNTPVPLRPEQVQSILRRMEAAAPQVRATFKAGQKVRIVEGPFADFIGVVEHIDEERAKVRVLVSFFGRETPVELDFLQVEKS